MQSITEREYLKASLKFLFIVVAMIYLYPVIGMMTYDPITSLLGAGSLPSVILMHGVHVLSLLIVSFLTGFIFPGDRWIVRSAAIISVLFHFIGDIRAEVYVLRNVQGYQISFFIRTIFIPLILIIMLVYCLSVPLHRLGRKLRNRPKVELELSS